MCGCITIRADNNYYDIAEKVAVIANQSNDQLQPRSTQNHVYLLRGEEK